MLGYAYQSGMLPLSATAINKAIELNGVAVDLNKSAFVWGRRAAFAPGSAEDVAQPMAPDRDIPSKLSEIIAHRVSELTAYQNAGYAERYRKLVLRAQQAEEDRAGGKDGLAHSRCQQRLQADGVQGRVRGRPTLH